MRSSNVNTPSVPKNAAHIFAPAAMAAAVIIDVPPPVTPPYTSTTIGAEEMMDTAAIIIVENNHFHHVLNIFFLARNPVTRPASILTGINAKFTGFAIPVTTFVSPPRCCAYPWSAKHCRKDSSNRVKVHRKFQY